MNKTIPISSSFALLVSAVPAMAQGPYAINGYPGMEPVTGAQMTDWPSGRFNMTESSSGSFLRFGSHYSDARGYQSHYRNHYRDEQYYTPYYDRDYDEHR